MPTAAKFGIVALIALALAALPGGDGTLNVIFTLLSVVLFTLIAVLVYRWYLRSRFELESLSERQRLVLYGSVGLAFLALCATRRLFDVGGAGVVAWLALLGLCSYGLYWVWNGYRSYG